MRTVLFCLILTTAFLFVGFIANPSNPDTLRGFFSMFLFTLIVAAAWFIAKEIGKGRDKDNK